MRVINEDGTFYVSWKFSNPAEKPARSNFPLSDEKPIQCLCTVWAKQENAPHRQVAQRMVTKYEYDVFNREKARKFALAAAMTVMYPYIVAEDANDEANIEMDLDVLNKAISDRRKTFFDAFFAQKPSEEEQLTNSLRKISPILKEIFQKHPELLAAVTPEAPAPENAVAPDSAEQLVA